MAAPPEAGAPPLLPACSAAHPPEDQSCPRPVTWRALPPQPALAEEGKEGGQQSDLSVHSCREAGPTLFPHPTPVSTTLQEQEPPVPQTQWAEGRPRPITEDGREAGTVPCAGEGSSVGPAGCWPTTTCVGTHPQTRRKPSDPYGGAHSTASSGEKPELCSPGSPGALHSAHRLPSALQRHLPCGLTLPEPQGNPEGEAPPQRRHCRHFLAWSQPHQGGPAPPSLSCSTNLTVSALGPSQELTAPRDSQLAALMEESRGAVGSRRGGTGPAGWVGTSGLGWASGGKLRSHAPRTGPTRADPPAPASLQAWGLVGRVRAQSHTHATHARSRRPSRRVHTAAAPTQAWLG